MKLLVVGEGPHELGDAEEPGALIVIVRRLRQSDDEIASDRVSRADLGRLHGKGNGYFKRAVRWMLEAERRGFDAVVLVIDEDGDPERRRAFSAAQDHRIPGIRRALGVAIRTFDAWILADEAALSNVLNRTVGTQPDPETHGDPKARCASLLSEASALFAQSTMYARVATCADLDRLAQRCPTGFGTFAARLRALSG